MKKGFTLIELLAVVIVIGVIALFVVPAIDATMKRIREESYEDQLHNIETAARNWGAEHIGELPTVGKTKQITLLDLKHEGYINKDIQNPKTKKNFADTLIVEITNNNGKYQYRVIDDTK